MAKELSYVLINPYTIRKSRTGGVINRLLSWGKLSLVAARMLAPSKELVEEYVEAMMSSANPRDDKERMILKEIEKYLFANYLPQKKDDLPPRVMLLLFEGENAVEELKRVVGHITRVSIGETVRGTYGDYIEEDGKIKYFEPAVLIGTNKEEVKQELKVLAKYSGRDGGVLRGIIPYPSGVKPEETLVMIKPDSFQELSSKAGNIIDRFSQTGLFIIGARVVRLGVKQAEEFYDPIRGRLAEKMKKQLLKEIHISVKKVLGFDFPEEVEERIAEELKVYKAQHEFNKIIKFITGRDPTEATGEEEGLEKCLALVYEGENAIQKIRNVLGETNPLDAAPGTVRKDFGQDVIKNGAHASDSPASAEREMRIIQIEEDDIAKIVNRYYPA
ncbi:nucleoside-diphosphate kinase [Candidatus Aerophobetes bacterium]|uniref:Nucleoside diphosphate kinase n=1 Tax=Aerophobetes bacterium TaxID=2030807 RepID=A0A497E7L1_UNCAE|nr:MAG: nucleoside-diphosphate kinase [Candidatus Aerophobetes bacterium]